MLEWLDSVAGPNYASAVLWTLAALLLLVLVLIVVKLIRNLTSGTYVAGGRNRKTRLAVMDATAVDSHRRLVLVRRDDIEHLLLIGGSADIVVERDIRLSAPRRPVLTGETGQARQPAAPSPQVQPNGQKPRPAQPAPAPVPRQPPAVAPSRELAARAASAVRPQPNSYSPQPYQPPQSVDDQIDDTLLHELEVSLDEKPASKPSKPPPSLDDEMTRLLGELGTPKR